jgi:glycosyltransferase involved in cell wall biosynthesis
MTNENVPIVSVCVCTYHRIELLKALLESLEEQDFSKSDFEVVVVDNDHSGSARGTVSEIKKRFPTLWITYEIEPKNGISNARNRTVKLARGKFLAFIDDDEYACKNWLRDLVYTLEQYNADVVLGPVLPDYPDRTHSWVIRSQLFERPRYETGTAVHSNDGRTSNALVRVDWTRKHRKTPFNIRFAHSGGEDHDFFKWIGSEGGRFVWCDTAAVSETIPRERQKIQFLLERRLRASTIYWRGVNSMRHSLLGWIEALKGLFAGVFFSLVGFLVLPFGLHRTMQFWVKSMSGFGRLIALSNVRLVGYRDINA